MLAFIFMASYLDNYRKSKEIINDISELREDQSEQIEELLEDINKPKGGE
jgi:hypothetical protein